MYLPIPAVKLTWKLISILSLESAISATRNVHRTVCCSVKRHFAVHQAGLLRLVVAQRHWQAFANELCYFRNITLPPLVAHRS